MKFGLYFLPAFDREIHRDAATLYEQMIDQVVLGEELGFESAWVSEHHFSDYGGDIPNPPMFMMALAQRTKRIRLGSAGVALPINRPLNTAEQLAMVDVASGGRVDIGVVRAFLNFEYTALNVDMAESRERFDESIDIILGTWANDSFSYNGKFSQFENVQLRPRPIQRKPRIIVGSIMTPQSVQNAGKRGFDLMVIPYAVPFAKTKEMIAIYHDSLDAAGHDPRDHSIMAPMHCYIHEDVEVAKATIREPIVRYLGYVRDAVAGDTWSSDYAGYQGMVKGIESLMDFDVMYKQSTLFGDPKHARECLEAVLDLGVTEISLVTQMPGLAQDKILESMRLFAREVMPHY
ncbi:MAG: natural product biosynthesis luciferase-like monooxygenase protein [Gammaproteobacteria bacterium]|jgi:natural product biosynthesis luciferase-like monooxygenase protein